MYEKGSFSLIAVAHFKKPERFKGLSTSLWGKASIPVCLDAKGAVNRFLGKGSKVGVVVLDPEGKVVYADGSPHYGSGISVTADGRKIKLVIQDLKKGLAKTLDKGLLAGLKVPARFKLLAKAIKLGQMDAAQALLKKIPDNETYKAFKGELTARFEKLRKKKKALFDKMVEEKKEWEAYKVGSSYVRCFPRATDASTVKSAVRKLKYKPVVKENMTAMKMYKKVVNYAFGARSMPTREKPKAEKKAREALRQIAKKFSGTEFGKYSAEFTQ